MPGLAWTEILLILAVAIVVIGPKDLPILMRTIGRFVGKARALAREFQESFEEIAREAELEELRKENEKLRQAAMVQLPTLTPGPSRAAPMAKAAVRAEPMTSEEEAKLRESTNAKVLAAEANEPPAADAAPLEPGGPAGAGAGNITPLRGGSRR